MSQLREQLQAAQKAYQTIRYQGDLAVDVRQAPRRGVLWPSLAAAASLAAALTIALLAPHRSITPAHTIVASISSVSQPSADQETTDFSLAVPALPEFPEQPQVSVSTESMTPPALPSIQMSDLVEPAQTSTTRQAL